MSRTGSAALHRVMSAFVKGDAKKYTALRMRVVHGKSIGEIAAETGLTQRTLHRLMSEFDEWVQRFERGEAGSSSGEASDG